MDLLPNSLVDAAAEAVFGVERSTAWDDIDVDEQNAYRDDGRAATVAVLRTLAEDDPFVSAVVSKRYHRWADELESA